METRLGRAVDRHEDQVIGKVLALRSPARSRVLACAIRYRLPEPTRLADQVVGAAKRALGSMTRAPSFVPWRLTLPIYGPKWMLYKVGKSPRIDQPT